MADFADPLPAISSVSKGPTSEQIIRHLRYAHQIALRAQSFGHHPFGAILVAPDHETILLSQGNVDTVNHAESVLIRTAATNFSPEYLWHCTLYTTVEPCAMCAATQYWGNVGRLVYGLTEARLLELTGNHSENPTLDIPCREIFQRGQKTIAVVGPIAEVEAEIATVHQEFWQNSQ
ncbi:MAG: nucleoside deaminase [Cyanobacteria bacterium P01_H01_bin.105]